MHVNSRHHSLAIAQGPSNRMHHLMMEFYSLDDVGQKYDLAQQEDRVAVKFGRHPNDLMTSFYMHTPSEFLIEHGWGGREVSSGWQPAEFTANAKASLHELCRVMGLAGKPHGMDGGEVEKYYRDGRIKEIAVYCESDVINTYRV